jgi:hypothetical protein
MTTISQRELVKSPLASAHRFLDAFFAEHRSGTDAAATITLRAGDVARAALVTLTPAHQPADMTPRYEVHWKDAQGGPYPVFSGTLLVAGDEDYDTFWLGLEGSYEPPGGLGGMVFDAVIGRRIAEATAHGLLDEIRAATETRFNAEELQKTR